MSQECRNARKRGLRCVTWIALRGYVDCAIIYGAMQVALRKQSAFMRPPSFGTPTWTIGTRQSILNFRILQL